MTEVAKKMCRVYRLFVELNRISFKLLLSIRGLLDVFLKSCLLESEIVFLK